MSEDSNKMLTFIFFNSLLCFVLRTIIVLTHFRQESTDKWYRNTVNDLLTAKRMKKLHTAGLDDTAIHIKM